MGLLNPFYEAVAWVLMRLHSLLSVPFGASSGWSWGLSIVLLVVLMRLILVPLFVKQMHAQRKMAALAPQVAALRKKYKNDKQTMNQEVMKLYQENGANPLAGCLPLVVQLPVFFALFNVLRTIAEDKTAYGLTPAIVASAQHAHIITATIADRIVTTPLPPYHLAPGPVGAKIVIGITVLISATTTFLTMRQSVKRGIGVQPGQDPDNPMANSQKYMMYIAPLFALSGMYWQFGLVLYWVTTNVWTLGQQHILFKNFHPMTDGAEAASAVGPAAKGTAAPAKAAAAGSAPARNTPARSAAAKTTGRDAAAASSDGKAGASAAGKGAANGASASSGGRTNAGATAKPGGKGTDGQRARGTQQRPVGRPAAAGPARPQAQGADKPSDGAQRRGLGRLVRGKPEPEPEPEVPAARLVRQQPVRQSRSKRSGKR
ncbi:MAG TPA: membrane protein insertase YidC [Streptosporangiaceae bacterium]|nr:membrane protein insertase YidC [Streptosporangiaceae bacterium]